MNPNDIQLLISYNAWADSRVLETARLLSSQALHARQSMGFGSVFETLAHILGAEQTWLTRWKGTSPGALPAASNYADLAQLAAAWHVIHNELRAFAATLDSASLHSTLTYQNTRGETFSQPLIWLILHAMNHSTEHRAQVAAMCTMAGHDVGPLDLIHYIRSVLPTPRNYV